MEIPRKPQRDKQQLTPEQFINQVPLEGGKTTQQDKEPPKELTRAITFSASLQKQDLVWMDETIRELSKTTRKKLTRSLLIASALHGLRNKSIEDIKAEINNL